MKAIEVSGNTLTVLLAQVIVGMFDSVDRRAVPVGEPATAEGVYQQLVELLRRLKLLRSSPPAAPRKFSA